MAQSDDFKVQIDDVKTQIDDFKPAKLIIQAYADVSRDKAIEGGSFKAMFNPESLSRNYEILYGKAQAIGTSAKEQRYANTIPSGLAMTLVLDGSGTSAMGLDRPEAEKNVSQRVDEFFKAVFKTDAKNKTYEPNYLVLTWGDTIFNCRLGSLNIRYTSFDRNGNPLRAELDLRFVSDESPKDIPKAPGKGAENVFQTRVVKTGDTLPLLCQEVYGSSAYHLQVAKANQLDSIRQLTPGQNLVFPHLGSLPG